MNFAFIKEDCSTKVGKFLLFLCVLCGGVLSLRAADFCGEIKGLQQQHRKIIAAAALQQRHRKITSEAQYYKNLRMIAAAAKTLQQQSLYADFEAKIEGLQQQ